MMPLTPSQEKAVTSSNEPLFIQAGAGTGKTFTLTNRVAYGLSEESGPLIDGVGRLLTITFTEKAAAELIGRIRAELRARGLSDESMQVDAAWISTIHAMCRRMLFNHAFEAGVDPGADMLADDQAAALSALAMESLLEDLSGDPRLEMLIAEYGTSGALDIIRDLSDVFALAPGGKDDFDFGPRPSKPDMDYVRNLLAMFLEARDGIDPEDFPPGKDTYPKNYECVVDAIPIMTAWIDSFDQELEWGHIALLLSKFNPPSRRKLSAPFNDFFQACRNAYDELKALSQGGFAYAQLQAASGLAVEHLNRYAKLKRQMGALDTNDLLIGAFRLLERDPSIARSYRDNFESIMVDEFQDTDSLQVGIVKMLCEENLDTLATVGDAQQSIYGFRGADLEVYRDMRQAMAEQGSKEVELTVNYRSQPDILRFVEDIFAKPEFFGGSFLKVTSGRSVESNPPWLSSGEPCVKVLFSAGMATPESGKKAAPTDFLRKADAVALVDEFERLHDQGASFGDMAILVRSTKRTYTGPFLDELRKRGIPCVIAGGSDFFNQTEVKLVSMLLRVIADRDDDEALYTLLGSDFFDISDDDLLDLANVNERQLKLYADEARSKVSLFDALKKRVHDAGENPDPLMLQALRTLDDALAAVQSLPLAQVVRNAVARSGWKQTLASRGVEGGAVFANVERACDMIGDFESLNGRSVFAASEYFRSLIESAETGAAGRAKLGQLVGSGRDAVQIMTIHSSKGLEFPIVAVAEFEQSSGGKQPKVISLSEHAKRYLAFNESAFSSSASPSFAATTDAADFLSYARQLKKQRDDEEAQRLLYVALTRARDMLIFVAHDGSFAKKGVLSKGLTGDCLTAVFGEEMPREHAVVRTEAGALVELVVNEAIYGEDAFEDEKAFQDELLVVDHCVVAPEPKPEISAYSTGQRDIYSYSSIAHREVRSEKPVAQAIVLPEQVKEPDTVSPVGSAFHLVAQWLAMTPGVSESLLDARMQAAVRRYDLDDDGRRRLLDSVTAWVSSECFARTQSYEQRIPEYAFCVDVDGVPLEGYIDLACFGLSGDALVIDYKTGTSGEDEDLHERYELQASCYAYALLSSGTCKTVDMVFVRPEAGMEEVAFSFTEADVPQLATYILQD